jgi:exosome complex RNA-binding protein Csl4
VKLEISPEEIQKFASLEPGKVLYGEVVSKGENQFSLKVEISNPENPEEVKTFTVNVPVQSQDEFFKFKKGEGTRVERVKASFDEMKVGDYVSVIVYPDKKEIGLSSIEE